MQNICRKDHSMKHMKILFVIPARGGSKGLIGKNIRPLAGKPLIEYSIDVARAITSDNNICVSTDDLNIIDVVEKYGLLVPFIRPENLASDVATTSDVLIHALNYYKENGFNYDLIVLLQPTSPLRKVEQVEQAIAMFRQDVEMVVSVKPSKAASILCKENDEGFLEMTINSNGSRRQDLNDFFEYNGAIYVIDAVKLRKVGLAGLTKRIKYVMNEETSVDIDTLADLQYAEFILASQK